MAATLTMENEKQAADMPTQLEQLYQELELVCYVASHDMLAPLRIMFNACETLKENAADALTAEGREALQTVDAEIAHLRLLLQGLQEYLRLQTFALPATPIQSQEILATAMTVLADEISASGATITYDALPRIMGHRGRLTRLFAFLLENAIKFKSDVPPCIHVSARRMENLWEFCIEDNGIGIHPDHREIVFRLFQRLHTAEEYPGYGIGLAMSQKIILSHGGTIRVEAAPEKGSRFLFTLPAADV